MKYLLACLALLSLLLAANAYAVNYMYLSNAESSDFGDGIRFWHEDTVTGPIRTNSCFYLMEDPVFLAPVIMGIESCETCGNGWEWEGADPTCGPYYLFPYQADWLRHVGQEQLVWEPGHPWYGRYFDHGQFDQAYIQIDLNHLDIWWGHLGVPVDILRAPDEIFMYQEMGVDGVAYFDCPIRVSGIVGGDLILCSSGTIGIADNIVYESTTDPLGMPTPGHGEHFALVSEGDIKILNTPANGRENSNGLGMAQTDPSLTNVVLNGYYVALGWSFTFEQQNDMDSCYSGPTPDDRGTLYVWGGLAQYRRGYVHRSNNGGTGYYKHYRWDLDLADFDLGVFNHEANRFDPDSLDFGNVAVGDTLWDTLHVDNYRVPVGLSAINASAPYYTPPFAYQVSQHFAFPIRFIPPHVGQFLSTITISMAGNTYQVPVAGRGIAGSGPNAHDASLYPNPFNNTTTLSFEVESAGVVRLDLYDVLGRHVSTLLDGYHEMGRQHITIDGHALASGVYFARLVTPSEHHTFKLLLLK